MIIDFGKFLLALIFSLIPLSNALAGERCGSKEGYLNELASSFLIPDQFPPETEALRSLVSEADYKKCQRLATVNLGESCAAHDLCYEAQLDKDQCDSTLQDSWVKACRKTYYKLAIDHYTCRIACESFVKLMSEAQRYNGQGFCPSCAAYSQATQN